jgi:hypothetical protein
MPLPAPCNSANAMIPGAAAARRLVAHNPRILWPIFGGIAPAVRIHLPPAAMNHGPLRIELTPLIDRPCQLTFFELKTELPPEIAYGSRPTDRYQDQRHPSNTRSHKRVTSSYCRGRRRERYGGDWHSTTGRPCNLGVRSCGMRRSCQGRCSIVSVADGAVSVLNRRKEQ